MRKNNWAEHEAPLELEETVSYNVFSVNVLESLVEIQSEEFIFTECSF